jgi:hypothetical protein
MTENEKLDAFSFFDFSMEEAQTADKELLSKPSERDGRICVCGHPVARHLNSGGIVYCKPTRMECPCKSVRSVLESSDVRPFLRKTNGPGTMHALGRGLASAIEKGNKVSWLVDMQCDRCGKEGPVSPVPVTQTGFSTAYPTGYDKLLCSECRLEV